MNKLVQLREALKNIAGNTFNSVFFIAKVISIEGDTCTLQSENPDGSFLDIPGIRLKPTLNNGNNKLLLTPKVNTYVLAGSLSGDWRDVCVLTVDELQKIEIKSDNLIFELDVETGKLKIENNNISVKDIFQKLTDLLKTFKVHTAVGASGMPLPDTQAALNNFETAFKQLLK